MTLNNVRTIAGALCLSALVAAPAAAQQFSFAGDDLVAAAEQHGASFARPDQVPELPAWWVQRGTVALGTTDRVCVDVPRGEGPYRSGEMIMGGHLIVLQADGPNKIWWKPLHDSSMEMSIDVRGVKIGSPNQPIHFEIWPQPTSSYSNETRQPIPEEAFFPGGARFDSPGRWIAVATSGSNWGCFVFDVPAEAPDWEAISARLRAGGNDDPAREGSR